MSACLYRVSKEKCMWEYEMELAAFLGGFGYACHVMGGAMVGYIVADVI